MIKQRHLAEYAARTQFGHFKLTAAREGNTCIGIASLEKIRSGRRLTLAQNGCARNVGDQSRHPAQCGQALRIKQAQQPGIGFGFRQSIAYFSTLFNSRPISAGFLVTLMPQDSMTESFS